MGTDGGRAGRWPMHAQEFALPHELICHVCGQVHCATSLAPREKALCTRCDTVLAKSSRFQLESALAFTVAGLILVFPAAVLPVVTVAKFGSQHTGLLFTGVKALWRDDM